MAIDLPYCHGFDASPPSQGRNPPFFLMARRLLDYFPREEKMKTSRHRIAELTSSIGAGVIGAGLGVLLNRYLRDTVAFIMLIGLAMHAWGMLDMRRLEMAAEGDSRPAWSKFLYWFCWIALGGLLVYIVLR
jgi:hypothetical protein